MTNEDIIDILVSTLNLLKDPNRWTKGVLGRDKNGNAIDYLDRFCYSKCLSGTILFFVSKKMKNCSIDIDYIPIMDSIKSTLDSENPHLITLSSWNDFINHETLLKTLEKTIERLKS